MKKVHQKPINLEYKTILFDPLHLISVGFGTGCANKAPGTFGTGAGVLLYYFMENMPLQSYLLWVTIMFFVGIWLCQRTANFLGIADHPAIVWDEIVGYLITMIAAPSGWTWSLLGFCLFRVLDILKPWPINRIDSNVSGGLGIMLDDAVAGVLALGLLQTCSYLLQ